MIKHLFILLLAIIPVFLFAQDNIIMTDGNARNGKIISEDGNFVKYVDYEGTVFSVKKDYIKEIHYHNAKSSLKKESSYQKNTSRSILSFNPLALLYRNLGIAYEHIVKNGYIGIKIPFSFAVLGREGAVFPNRHLYQTGIDLNIYPAGQGSFKYFVGPSFHVGKVESVDVFEGITGKCEPIQSNHTTITLNNGFMWNSPSNFSMSTSLGLGVRSFKNKDYNHIYKDENNRGPVIHMECTLGYSF